MSRHEPAPDPSGEDVARAWQPPPARPGLHRRLYDWVMSWADTPHGVAALFAIAVIESSVFPIPPDVLLIALGVAQPRRAVYFAGVCTVGSVVGGVAGYGIGWLLWEGLDDFFFAWIPGFTPEVFGRVQGWYDEYGVVAVLIAGFTPIPYKVFTIASGVFQMNFPAFVIASVVSRGLRFFIEGVLIARYGAAMREVLERNFNLMTALFVILLLGGFAVLRLMH